MKLQLAAGCLGTSGQNATASERRLREILASPGNDHTAMQYLLKRLAQLTLPSTYTRCVLQDLFLIDPFNFTHLIFTLLSPF